MADDGRRTRGTNWLVFSVGHPFLLQHLPIVRETQYDIVFVHFSTPTLWSPPIYFTFECTRHNVGSISFLNLKSTDSRAFNDRPRSSRLYSKTVGTHECMEQNETIQSKSWPVKIILEPNVSDCKCGCNYCHFLSLVRAYNRVYLTI